MKVLACVGLGVAIWGASLNLSFAVECSTNCNDACRVPIPFGSVVSPGCKVACDAAKKARICLPLPPSPPNPANAADDTKVTVFNGITAAAQQMCSGRGFTSQYGAVADRNVVERAIQILYKTGRVTRGEFDGVQIRLCSGLKNPGVTPTPAEILLDGSLLNDVAILAATLGHELQHVRQWRRLGERRFRVDYATYFLDCGGCQNRGHAYEREAMDFQDQLEEIFERGPVVLLASNFSRGDGVRTPQPGDAVQSYGSVLLNRYDGNKLIPPTGSKRWVEWDFELASSGNYNVYATYASAEVRPLVMSIDGVPLLTLATEHTKGYMFEHQKQHNAGAVYISSGRHTVRLEVPDAGANWPHFQLLKFKK